jgi:hypothetical protein
VCPPGYGYTPLGFARAAELAADTAYVIGGLYGNPFALDAIDALAALERTPPRRVFNGDFHWFDAEPALFAAIQRRVLEHTALRGNVETEIAAADTSAGCGCAYPEAVPDADVARSNAIMARLRGVARSITPPVAGSPAGAQTGPRGRAGTAAHPAGAGPVADPGTPASANADANPSADPGANAGGELAQALGRLPMHAVLGVGPLRVAVVHGDAWSLAGWRFAHAALHGADRPHATADPGDIRALRLAAAFSQAAVDGFACSHTCAPALKVTDRGFVINNGAAGMANFAASCHGVITRLSVHALPDALGPARLYGLNLRGVWIDALRVDFDLAGWLARFDRIWPAGSPAALSYRARLVDGPAFSIDAALGRAPAPCP